ncbi:mannitol dehydrogenase family protein [Agrobacterium sp. ES01]|uniref:mannitol dehydrogenase family protein n=1 Tax=Agrobacterium sp. ES01 TaxID=3420714 RepID=UPI003D146B37
MLTEAGLPAEYPRLKRPSDAARPSTAIVHLGLGAFYRAHGAVYIAEAMTKSGGDWGIAGVSLVRPDQRDALAPQDFAYTAVELGPEGETPRVISVITDVLVAREDPAAVLGVMSAPETKIVSLTVTEKGYCHEPSTGKLNRDHPDIAHDLEHPDAPRSAVGFLVRALDRRRKAGTRPFTVLCCDNLPENGKLLRGLVLELSGLIDNELKSWIGTHATFPSTMVDRIVPATKPEDIDRLAEKTGVMDLSPVMHEPFSQWVIEDDFVDGERPDFAAVGVELVEDVTPFEHMKLRCLNGTHSSLAYLGYLSGHETISETVADPVLAAFCKSLWAKEILPILKAPPGVDLQAYTGELFERYANPAIRHRTWQIAMDGSQKLPQRILGTIAENLDAGRTPKGLCLAVAAWMRYVGGTDEKGNAIDVRDPLSADLKALSDGASSAEGKVDAILAVRKIFPETLASNPIFRDALVQSYKGLVEKGARVMAKERTDD